MVTKKLIKYCITKSYLLCQKLFEQSINSQHYNNSLVGYFGINITRKLIEQKQYYWLSFKKDIKAYIKSCNVGLALKALRHKPYNNLQLLPIPTYQQQDKSYDSIPVIIDQFIKIVHYELVKITINILRLAEVIFNIVVIALFFSGLSSNFLLTPSSDIQPN